jgi:hypothetical protein
MHANQIYPIVVWNAGSGMESCAKLSRLFSSTARRTVVYSCLAMLYAWSAALVTAVDHCRLVPVQLGTAGSFAVISPTMMSLDINDTFHGDVLARMGIIHAHRSTFMGDVLGEGDEEAIVVQTGLSRAINDITRRPISGSVIPFNIPGDVTVHPGVYDVHTYLNIHGTTNVQFHANGDPNAIWIIRITGYLSIAANVKMTLHGTGCARNIFFWVSDFVSIGANSQVIGTIIASSYISVGTGASTGPILSIGGAVTLGMNTNVCSYCRPDSSSSQHCCDNKGICKVEYPVEHLQD